jgi:hypothetical protein
MRPGCALVGSGQFHERNDGGRSEIAPVLPPTQTVRRAHTPGAGSRRSDALKPLVFLFRATLVARASAAAE